MAGTARSPRTVDAVVVGAGFGGLYALHRLRSLGFDVQVFEAGDDVGGTWYWNRYPGARCDVESLEYSYSFSTELEQEWEWTERYPTQPEILRYLRHVADRFDLRRDIAFETRVTSAVLDEETCRWTVATDTGEIVEARYCIMATGCLSSPEQPDVPGLGSFRGRWLQTSAWPREPIDLSGQRVAVIGTGSSGIQTITAIAPEVAHLTVFQRTPNFSVPAQNGPLSDEEQRALKSRYREHRQAARESTFGVPCELTDLSALEANEGERRARYEAAWRAGGAPRVLLAYADLLSNIESNRTVADFVRSKIRGIVHDPETAAMLCPTDHPMGTKRLCVDTGYYETYNRDNVSLVDIRRTPVEKITPVSIRTSDAEYEVDTIIFAIGFDAMTGALFRIDIRGRGATPLRKKWADGPLTYLGIGTAGFPNLFVVAGPGSPSVLSNMVVSVEQHVDWIADCIGYLEEHGLRSVEPDAGAEEEWSRHVTEVADKTLFPQANSWYVGANVPGKPRVFSAYVGGVGAYRKICDEVAAEGYRGFVLQS